MSSRDRPLLPIVLLLAPLGVIAITTAFSNSSNPASAQNEQRADQLRHTTASLQGRVVWLADALRRRSGVETDRDAQLAVVALETTDGQLHPLVKDARGRAFFLDPRFRDIDVELTVRQFPGSPFVQVVQVYSIKSGHKYLIDYWCDICSIPMYELKECECCQGPIRIRERLADDR